MNKTLIGTMIIVALLAMYILSSLFSLGWKGDGGGLDAIGGVRGDNFVDDKLNMQETRGAGYAREKIQEDDDRFSDDDDDDDDTDTDSD